MCCCLLKCVQCSLCSVVHSFGCSVLNGWWWRDDWLGWCCGLAGLTDEWVSVSWRGPPAMTAWWWSVRQPLSCSLSKSVQFMIYQRWLVELTSWRHDLSSAQLLQSTQWQCQLCLCFSVVFQRVPNCLHACAIFSLDATHANNDMCLQLPTYIRLLRSLYKPLIHPINTVLM